MATRSTIAVNNRVVYCHYDGYPEGVGKTLNENYRDEAKANALIDRGGIRFLKDTVEDTTFLDETIEIFSPAENPFGGIEYFYTYNREEGRWECKDEEGVEQDISHYGEKVAYYGIKNSVGKYYTGSGGEPYSEIEANAQLWDTEEEVEKVLERWAFPDEFEVVGITV